MKKADAAIIVAVLAVCAVLFLIMNSAGEQVTGRLSAEIYIRGELVQTVPLDEDGAARELEVSDGKITILIEHDGVSVTLADCPMRTCVHTGKITMSGQMISCLPNRVIIKLVGESGAQREVDIIA